MKRDYLEINGFETDLETTGDGGLTSALDRDYQLLILDLMLLETNGFETCRTIRKTGEIPIILVTTRKEDIDKIRGFGLGADDYIVKPFSPGELVARVKAHLARYERLSGQKTNAHDQCTRPENK